MHTVVAVTFYAVFLVGTSLQFSSSEPKKNVFGRCILPLGMEEGKIPDDAITASSSYEMKSVGPQNARIRQEKNGGAWCPKAQISSAIREYLEVDLTRNHLIAWTETQGRFGNGQGQEYAEAFFLEYFRNAKWHQYKNLKGDKVLRGNSNTYVAKKQKLELPFVASRVRFVPYSQHPRTVCMRVEIYGCVWEQHIVSYSGPTGTSNGPDGSNVEDTSYDGIEIDGRLMNGLGQLTDGILGEATEIVSPSTGGTNWVGWTDRPVVELIFEFKDLRQFLNCSVHVADMPERGVQMFSTLQLWFSMDGKKYHDDPETLDIRPEDRSSFKVNSIGLQSRIGRFVKMEFTLAGPWLLISEITFESVSGTRNLSGDKSMEGLSGTYQNESETKRDRLDPEGLPVPDLNATIFDEPSKEDSTPDAFPVGSSQTYIGLVSGLLTVVGLLLTCTTFLMKQRGRNKVALLQKHTALLCSSAAPGITINAKDVNKPPNPIDVNGLSQSRFSLRTRSTLQDRKTSSRSDKVQAMTATENSEQACERSTVYQSTYSLFSEENQCREAHSSAREPECSDFKSRSSFTGDNPMIDFTIPSTFSTKRSSSFQSARSQQRVHEGYYAATDILTIKKREQSTALSLFTPLRIREEDVRLPRSIESFTIQRVSRHRLRILDKLGEGSFGLVHLCEAKGLQNPEVGTVQNRQTVIVRSLWRGVVDSLRKDFANDMHALSTIRNPNIARVIALVEEEPLGAVFEYGQLGDLPSFLEQHEKTGATDSEIPISFAYRLNFSTQIASGMKYLESLNIVHSDLAARNCIVGQNLTVKVSDHAMYCGKYDRQYYVDGYYAKVPLRWMSWEAALLGHRNSHGDVWSYAITVWEILTSCQDLPYSDLTSEQVLENLSHWYRTDSASQQPRVLPKPSCCPDDLYRLMTKCWSKEPKDRPTFEDIYLYLERLGFD